VTPARLSTALLLALAALLAGAAPLVAAVCAGGDACPCPGMAGPGLAAERGRCDGPVLTVEMGCCRVAAPAAAAPSPSALVGPQLAAAPPAAGEAARVLDAFAAARPAAGAELARAERRSSLGLFTLHDVFRI
jgi:hypothetical protein